MIIAFTIKINYVLLWAGCGFNYCVTGEQK